MLANSRTRSGQVQPKVDHKVEGEKVAGRGRMMGKERVERKRFVREEKGEGGIFVETMLIFHSSK